MNNQFNLTYETDLNQGLASTTLPMLFLYDDSLAHVFTVKTTRDGKPNSLTGSTVHAYFMPSNSEECVYMAGTVDENGYAVVSLEPACYAFIGRFSLVIRAEKGSAVTSIFRGEGYVGQSHTDAILDPGNALPSLAALEARINALDAAKAPAGYGLGVHQTEYSAIDTLTKNGWYKCNIPNGYLNNVYVGYNVLVRVDGYSTWYATQTVYGTSSAIPIVTRSMYDNVWGEWESENPPMMLGVEYRTTERHNGAVVYAKAINFGTLPSGGYKDVAHGIDTKSMNVRFEIIGGNTNLLLQPNPNITSVIINSTIIQIATSASMGAYDAVVKLWYTK